jgi:hypothetical protein
MLFTYFLVLQYAAVELKIRISIQIKKTETCVINKRDVNGCSSVTQIYVQCLHDAMSDVSVL